MMMNIKVNWGQSEWNCREMWINHWLNHRTSAVSVTQLKTSAAKGTDPGRKERTVSSLRRCKAAPETRNLTLISVTKLEKSPNQASRRQPLHARPSIIFGCTAWKTWELVSPSQHSLQQAGWAAAAVWPWKCCSIRARSLWKRKTSSTGEPKMSSWPGSTVS